MVFGTIRYVWFILLYYITQTLSFHYITRTISHNQAKKCYNCHAAQSIPFSLLCLCLSLDFYRFQSLSVAFCLDLMYVCLHLSPLSVALSFSISVSLHLCLSSFLLWLCFSLSLPLCLYLCSSCLYFSMILSSMFLSVFLSLSVSLFFFLEKLSLQTRSYPDVPCV